MRIFRNILLIVVPAVLSFATTAEAREPSVTAKPYPLFTFGIEGGYFATHAAYRHVNFVSSFGYRVDSKTWDKGYHSNGEILLHAGINVSGNVNLSLYTGYAGMNKQEYTYPFTLRCTYLFGKPEDTCRWYAFADAGTGVDDTDSAQKLSYIAKIGGGYRITLSRSSKLDFMLTLRNIITSPDVNDRGVAAGFVTGERLRMSRGTYLSLGLGIGLTF